MAFPTTDNKSELQAVNQILASVGQAPVTSLDQTNPDVALCYETLTDVSRQIQAEGWTYNKEFEYPIEVNSNKNIVIPPNVLQMDLSRGNTFFGSTDTVVRSKNGQKLLYDRTGHTYEWEVGEIKADIVWYFDWIDLPIPIQDYIVARSSTIVSQRLITDANLYQMLTQQEIYTRAMAMEYECNQGDHTFFGHPVGHNNYQSYQPYHALYR
jgi:hypothetical protein